MLGTGLSACSSAEAPRADAGSVATTAAPEAPPPVTAAPLPQVPPPERPFSAGDVIPEGFAAGPPGEGEDKSGPDAFVGGVPIPWQCQVVSRTKTTLAARCETSSSVARSRYGRIFSGFGRDMFGGRWEEEEQFAFFGRPREKGLRVDISADRDRALYGAVTNGAELRVHGEPAGKPASMRAPPPGTTPDDLFLRAFGQWRCGTKDVFVGVRRIVIASGGEDAVCNAVRLAAAGGSRVQVTCASVTGDFEPVLGAREAARMSGQGFPIDVRANDIAFDGTSCRRGSSGHW